VVSMCQRYQKMQVAYAVSKDLPFNNGDNVGLMINGLGGTRRVSFSCCTGAQLYAARMRDSMSCETMLASTAPRLRWQVSR
jgi:dihydroxyacetone kinase